MKVPTTYRLINLLQTATTWPEESFKEMRLMWESGARPCTFSEGRGGAGGRFNCLRIRLRAALLVFRGLADAVVWPEDDAVVFGATSKPRPPAHWEVDVSKAGEDRDANGWLYVTGEDSVQTLGESMQEAYELLRLDAPWLKAWEEVRPYVEEDRFDYYYLHLTQETYD